MNFDIIKVEDEYYETLSKAQRKVLRDAQKKKNALHRKAENDIAFYRRKLYTNSMQVSTLLEHKSAAIWAEFDREVEILREQLEYDLNALVPDSEDSTNYGDAPYTVDFSLSYTDRYIIVRDYYMNNIPDPYDRVEVYLQDKVAKKYLGNYYNSLYNVLLTYCR